MGLTKPLIHEIDYKTWLINELGCNNMYVLEGTERSLVVDAGMGYCNFRQIVESLTDKPYDVVITHAHPDHIGMMHQFDRIWINEKEITEAPARSWGSAQTKGGWDTINWLTRKDFDMEEFYMNNNTHIGNYEVWTPDESVICRGDIDTEICYIKEGDTFDLGGGRIVTAYDLPGHSPGHMYFVDEGQRIAFTGDCVNFNNGTRYHSAYKHCLYLLKFLSMYGVKFDRVFTGHTTYAGRLDVKSMDIRVVEGLLEAHRAYLRGEGYTIEMRSRALHPDVFNPTMCYGEGPYHIEVNEPPCKWAEGEEHIIP